MRHRKGRRWLGAGPLIVILAAIVVGALIGRYRVFPYQLIAGAKHLFVPVKEVTITSDPEYVDRVALFANTVGPADLVMLGDSIVARGDWIDLAPDASIANRAISGDTTEGLRARLADVLRLSPDRVFLMIGLNDFLENRSVDETYRDYLAIVDELLVADVSVVIQATLRVGTRNPYFFELNAKVDKLNSLLIEAAAARGIAFFDTNAVLAPMGVLGGVFTEDGVHLNHRGYACWIAALRATSGANSEAGEHRVGLPECRAILADRLARTYP